MYFCVENWKLKLSCGPVMARGHGFNRICFISEVIVMSKKLIQVKRTAMLKIYRLFITYKYVKENLIVQNFTFVTMQLSNNELVWSLQSSTAIIVTSKILHLDPLEINGIPALWALVKMQIHMCKIDWEIKEHLPNIWTYSYFFYITPNGNVFTLLTDS